LNEKLKENQAEIEKGIDVEKSSEEYKQSLLNKN